MLKYYLLSIIALFFIGCQSSQDANVTGQDVSSSASSSSTSEQAPSISNTSRNLLVIRINYNDIQFKSSSYTWSRKIFGYSNHQLNNYMREISNATFSYKKVLENQETLNDGLITVSLSKNHPDSGASPIIHSDLAAALIQADEYVDFSHYDTNHDGALSQDEFIPVFIIAGNEDAYSGENDSKGVWAHQSCTTGSNAPILDNVRLMACSSKGVYALFGERHADSAFASHDASIGIIAHELGHAAFHLPDLYDTFNVHAGIGFFDLMAAGMWGQENANEVAGNTPTHMSAWSKIYSGFVQADVLSQVNNESVTLTESASNNYNIIKLPINANEYFLLENRNNSGYDRGLYALSDTGNFNGGMAIWHIDESVINNKLSTNSVNNIRNHKGVDLEEASDNELDFDPLAPGNSKNLFYYNHATTFNNTTTPNTKSYTNTASNISVSDISHRSEVMSATISNPN